jgi:hypothetical protein
MTPEFGKYYVLDKSSPYFSVDLQRFVEFCDKIVVKCEYCFQEKIFFGKLINLSAVPGYEYETNNEIEFSAMDVLDEYRPKAIRKIVK